MKFIELTNSERLATVDDEDIERIILLDTQWYVQFDKYGIPTGIRSIRKIGKSCIFLHRFVMNCPYDDGYNVDHIYHNIFDNRKSQLRKVTFSQSQINRKVRKDSASGISGIHFRKDRNKWQACINRKNLGLFETLEEAVTARKNAEKEIFGEFAYKG